MIEWLRRQCKRNNAKVRRPIRRCPHLEHMEQMEKRLRALEACERATQGGGLTTAQVLDEWLNGKEKRE